MVLGRTSGQNGGNLSAVEDSYRRQLANPNLAPGRRVYLQNALRDIQRRQKAQQQQSNTSNSRFGNLATGNFNADIERYTTDAKYRQWLQSQWKQGTINGFHRSYIGRIVQQGNRKLGNAQQTANTVSFVEANKKADWIANKQIWAQRDEFKKLFDNQRTVIRELESQLQDRDRMYEQIQAEQQEQYQLARRRTELQNRRFRDSRQGLYDLQAQRENVNMARRSYNRTQRRVAPVNTSNPIF